MSIESELQRKVNARIREGATKVELELELAGKYPPEKLKRALRLVADPRALDENRHRVRLLAGLIVLAGVFKVMGLLGIWLSEPYLNQTPGALAFLLVAGLAIPSVLLWGVWVGNAYAFNATGIFTMMGVGRSLVDAGEYAALGALGVAILMVELIFAATLIVLAFTLQKRIFFAHEAARPTAG